jgi:hypothetical protein
VTLRKWDWDSSKGTGAEVRPVESNPPEPRDIRPIERQWTVPQPKARPTAVEQLKALDVSRSQALMVAYRLANFSRRRTHPIPQELRDAVARLIELVSGDVVVSREVRMGIHDDHLTELLND